MSPFNLFGVLLEIAETFASDRNITVKSTLTKINSDISDTVNVSSPFSKYNQPQLAEQVSVAPLIYNPCLIIYNRVPCRVLPL